MFKKYSILKRNNNRQNDKIQSKSDMQRHSDSVNLAELENGNFAKVLDFLGGSALKGKLEAMGILPGTTILKKSAIPAKGPVIVEKGALQFALGYDMAEKILVEPLK